MAILRQISETEILIITKDGHEIKLINDPKDPYDIETLEKIWGEV